MTLPPIISREMLGKYFGGDPRLVAAFEEQSLAVQETATAVQDTVGATEALQDATVLSLSPNAAFTNERILTAGTGLSLSDDGVHATLSVTDDVARSSGGFVVTFVPLGDCTLFLPLTGYLATRDGVETFSNKTLVAPKISGLGNYVDDAAAAAGGISVGGLYRNGSVLMVRVS